MIKFHDPTCLCSQRSDSFFIIFLSSYHHKQNKTKNRCLQSPSFLAQLFSECLNLSGHFFDKEVQDFIDKITQDCICETYTIVFNVTYTFF